MAQGACQAPRLLLMRLSKSLSIETASFSPGATPAPLRSEAGETGRTETDAHLVEPPPETLLDDARHEAESLDLDRFSRDEAAAEETCVRAVP